MKNKDQHFGSEIFEPLPIFFWVLFACLWLVRPVPLHSDDHFHVQSTNPSPQLPTFAPTPLYGSPTAIHTFASNTADLITLQVPVPSCSCSAPGVGAHLLRARAAADGQGKGPVLTDGGIPELSTVLRARECPVRVEQRILHCSVLIPNTFNTMNKWENLDLCAPKFISARKPKWELP